MSSHYVCQVLRRSTQWFSLYHVHKLISLFVHCDHDLWHLTSKIHRVHPLTMAKLSAKFDKEAHNGLVSILFTRLFPYLSIVNLAFDLWPPKSIESILALWLACMPSLMKKYTTVLVSMLFTSLCPYMSIVTMTFDVWPPSWQGFFLSS